MNHPPRNRLADLMDLDLAPWMEGAVDAEEACRFLRNIDRKTLDRHVRNGLIKRSKIGGLVAFSKRDLAAFLARGAA